MIIGKSEENGASATWGFHRLVSSGSQLQLEAMDSPQEIWECSCLFGVYYTFHLDPFGGELRYLTFFLLIT